MKNYLYIFCFFLAHFSYSQTPIVIGIDGISNIKMHTDIDSIDGYSELFRHPGRSGIRVTKGKFQYYYFNDSTFKIGNAVIDKFIFSVNEDRKVNYIYLLFRDSTNILVATLDSLFGKTKFNLQSTTPASDVNTILYWSSLKNGFSILLTKTLRQKNIPGVYIELSVTSAYLNENEITPFVSID